MGSGRVGASGGLGAGLVLELTSFGANTGGGGSWTVTPSLPATVGGDEVVIEITTVATDASSDGSLELNFDATGSPTGNLNWSLDPTLFISPSTFGPPEEWTASITSSDPTSPGSAVVLITFASIDVFEQGLQLGVLVDDGVGLPVSILIHFNHYESP